MVVVIIVNWNGGQKIIDCIRSIERCGTDQRETIIVDNASSDGSLQEIKSLFDGLRIIENKTNNGFSIGCNQGIRYANDHFQYNFVWLLNPDTVVQDDALSLLTAYALSNPQLGLIGSKLVEANGQIQALGGGYKIPCVGQTRHRLNSNQTLSYVSGASMLIHREVINHIGLLDEKIFLYWDDVDYSWRAMNKGYCIGWCKDSVIVHNESSSTHGNLPLKDYYYHHAHAYVLLKHKKYLSLFLAVIAKVIIKLRPSGITLLRTRLSGWIDGFRTFFFGHSIEVLSKK